MEPRTRSARQADVIVLGSPIYSGYPTGVYRAFLERLAFPVHSCHYEDGKPLCARDKVAETASIFTMNCPEAIMEDIGYPAVLESNTASLKTVFGASGTLYACDTYQFADYSRYDVTLSREEDKRAHREGQFPKDLAAARALGKRLVEKAAQYLSPIKQRGEKPNGHPRIRLPKVRGVLPNQGRHRACFGCRNRAHRRVSGDG